MEMSFWICLLPIIASSIIGYTMDSKFDIELKPLYWALGVLGGFFTGVWGTYLI